MANIVDMDKAVETFKTVSLEVVTQMTKCKIDSGKTSVKEHFYTSYEYSFIIGVTGKYEGAVTMSLKKETACFLASAMLGNKPVKQFNELAESAIRELVNLVVSRTFILLAGDEPINITPPTFVRGSNVSLAVANIQKTYVTTLNTSCGVIEFNISLANNRCDTPQEQ